MLYNSAGWLFGLSHSNILCTGCSFNIVFFLKILWCFWTLQVLLQRWGLPCHCVHTLTPRGTTPREARVRHIYFKIFEKKHNISLTPCILMLDIWDILQGSPLCGIRIWCIGFPILDFVAAALFTEYTGCSENITQSLY